MLRRGLSRLTTTVFKPHPSHPGRNGGNANCAINNPDRLERRMPRLDEFVRPRTYGRTDAAERSSALPSPSLPISRIPRRPYGNAYISFDRHGSRDTIKKWMLLCSFHWQIANIENCRYSASKSKVQYIGTEITNGKKKIYIYIYMCVCVCVCVCVCMYVCTYGWGN